MGVVYHANYLVWFEVGRVDLIRSVGLDYKSMEQVEGVGIAVVEAVVRYKAPARYDDELIVRTTLAHTRGSIIAFDYKLYRAEDDLLLAEGSTTHIVVDRQMKRAHMPERFAQAFGASSSNGNH
jgi:acyl-CoA thioester hydrolase